MRIAAQVAALSVNLAVFDGYVDPSDCCVSLASDEELRNSCGVLALLSKQVSLVRRFLRVVPLLFEVRTDEALRPLLRSYLGFLPLCVFSEPWLWVRKLFAARDRFANPDQRPHSFYAPHLGASPFLEANETSRFLEQNAAAIRAEFAQIPGEVDSPSKVLLDRGDWKTFPLVRAAQRHSENIALCPATWAAVEACPRPPEGVRGGVYFSILDPGTHIAPHCGPSNLKYRYHLTITPAAGARIRSGSEWRSWSPDTCLILDDSFEHEVIHEGDTRRVVLIVDCWHSDLTSREREFLTVFHRRL